jgi:hypothetical protein
MRLLPDIFSVDSFNIAELHACVRDGEMFALDTDFILSDSPDDAVSRVRVVCRPVDPRFVATGWSAAWIHHAIAAAPARHTVALRDGLRLGFGPQLHYDLSQMAFESEDVTGSSGQFVTTPLRTAIDLARFEPDSDLLVPVLAMLLAQAGAKMTDITAVIERGRNLPHKQRAYRLLAEGLTLTHPIDVIDGIDAANTVEKTVEMHRVAHLEDNATQR